MPMPTLLLLPGLMCDASVWAPQVAAGLKKTGAHTALADIRESVAELAYYRGFMGALGGLVMSDGSVLGPREIAAAMSELEADDAATAMVAAVVLLVVGVKTAV